jgi:hypothetical protein
MGMFDRLTCRYPLPVKGANDLIYATKDTPAQYLDNYEIREDGSLWHQEYDIEDHSDPKAKGIMALAGCMTKVARGWVPELMTGEIVFYHLIGDKGWIEFSAYFEAGKIVRLNLLEHVPETEPAGKAGGS